MDLGEAYKAGKIDRFEIMLLAQRISDLNFKNKHVSTLKNITYLKGDFLFDDIIHIKKKEVLFYFSLLVTGIQTITNKRLASIFMNHYLACQGNTSFFKFFPRSRVKPFITACGGLSGSGKSRIAREISPFIGSPFGAVVIRDDIVRKQLAKVSFDTVLGPEYYTTEYEKKVYKEMRRLAKHVLKNGHPVILDALFYNKNERLLIQKLAHKNNIPFVGLWMEAPLSVRSKRVQKRQKNPSVVKTMKAVKEQFKNINPSQITWHYVLTDNERETTLKNVINILKKNNIYK